MLKKVKDAVSYNFEEISSGAKVRIQTSDKKALSAVHDFLRFQIADHHTGDPRLCHHQVNEWIRHSAIRSYEAYLRDLASSERKNPIGNIVNPTIALDRSR